MGIEHQESQAGDPHHLAPWERKTPAARMSEKLAQEDEAFEQMINTEDLDELTDILTTLEDRARATGMSPDAKNKLERLWQKIGRILEEPSH